MPILSPLLSTIGKQANKTSGENVPHIISGRLYNFHVEVGWGWGEGSAAPSRGKRDSRGVNDTLIFENLRLGGFKLNINIKKKKMRSVVVVTTQRRPKLGCGPEVPAPLPDTAVREGEAVCL